MAKKNIGQCCICGKESELTFEHIPPRAAFNNFNMKLYDFWGYLLRNNTKYHPFQRGAGKYSLCASCNNRTGEWYGAAYAEFASQGMKYFKSNAQGIVIRMYLQKEARSKFDSISGQMNISTGERFLGSEWSYPPFSYILVCDKNYTNYRSLNELCSIREFLEYNYDDRVTLYMNIPRKPCNPTTLDFRAGIPALETIIKSSKNQHDHNTSEGKTK